jgi:hypothetical protein
VYKVNYNSQAEQNDGYGFLKYVNQADKKIFFVKYANQADIIFIL